ncbi:MAG TPA: patatin-like phospholipase family protein [Puia sp.]|nr:patatin-like phospholipase family protein [Puia sp.]
METVDQVPANSLEKIALSCSGGGYRAAAFHLGTMSYLNRLQYQGHPLLENVKMLSTVSGGTITGIVYTLQRQQGKTFPEIYDFLLARLKTLDLVKLGIEKLNPGAHWQNTNKRRNLINAFAELYDEYFTSGATFAELAEMHCHLEAVAFNSTEFNNAVDFRFRNRGSGIFGNYYLRINQAQAAEIRLADAMAASSCFPGGFEPILWPTDFLHAASPNLKALPQTAPVGIMDGGIYDNQGIDTILRYKGSAESPYFDCIIISDVSSPYMNPYKPTPEVPQKGFGEITLGQMYRRVRDINTLMNWILPCLCLFLGFLPLVWNYRNCTGTGISLTAAVVLLLLWIGKLLLFRRLLRIPGRLRRWLLEKNPHIDFYLKKLSGLDLGAVSLQRARPLLLDRLNSLLSLLLNVFLKIVRRLNYNLVYSDENWRNRRIANLIHRLTREDYETQSRRPAEERTETVRAQSLFKSDFDTDIGENLGTVASAAAAFGTTLWFTPEDQLSGTLDKLLATGEFTLCFNMIQYLEDLLFGDSPPSPEAQPALHGLLEQCKTDWASFKKDPFFLQKKTTP